MSFYLTDALSYFCQTWRVQSAAKILRDERKRLRDFVLFDFALEFWYFLTNPIKRIEIIYLQEMYQTIHWIFCTEHTAHWNVLLKKHCALYHCLLNAEPKLSTPRKKEERCAGRKSVSGFNERYKQRPTLTLSSSSLLHPPPPPIRVSLYHSLNIFPYSFNRVQLEFATWGERGIGLSKTTAKIAWASSQYSDYASRVRAL